MGKRWETWIRQPQTLRFRKVLFQIHLWTGVGLGLYLLMLSVTGSVLVYRLDLEGVFQTPKPAFDPSRPRLSQEELTAAARRVYPDWNVTRVGTRITRRNPVIEIWVEKGAEKKERLFDPYTGEDLGDAIPVKVRALNVVAELHDELLLGRDGRVVNAVGSGFVTLLVLTGGVIWWPGARNWRRSLALKRGSSWIRFNWDLHSAVGFWGFFFVLIWGVSGIYLGYPEPFANVIDRFSDPGAILGERPADIVISWLTRLHFGRFREAPALKAVWAVLGLLPAVMFVTGFFMWWNRVLRKRLLDRAA